MDENRYITDNVLRRYLGMDEIDDWITKRGVHINIGKNFTNYKKTGKIYLGLEQIWLPTKEYAEVSSVFNSYILPEGEIFLTKEVYSYGGYARYYGVKMKDKTWFFYDREDLNYDIPRKD